MMMQLQLQCMMGLRCNDFAMIAADQINTQSICVMQTDLDKLYPVADKLVMGVTGELGDAIQISQLISKSIDLYQIKNSYKPSLESIVHFTRKTMADNLRSSHQYNVNMLIAGYEEGSGGLLYYLDPLATCVSMPFASHGWGGIFIISLLQHYHKPTMSEAEAYETIQMCVRVIHQRLLLNLPNFNVKVINKQGISNLPPICPQTFMQ